MTLWYMFSDDKDFEYEVDWKDLKFAFEQIFKKIARVKDNECLPIERLMNVLIDNKDIWGIEKVQEYFEDELTEYFYEDASIAWAESLDSYNGSDDYFRDKL